MKVLLIAALALLAQQAAAALPDLQAIVRYETVSQGADGVEKTLRYSEKWVRQGGHVWREWSDAGFDGSWARASQLVDIAQLHGFAKTNDSADTIVYTKGGKTLRWSQRWQMPLRVSLLSADGRQRETITVEPQALPPSAPQPWKRSANWPARDYLDTLD